MLSEMSGRERQIPDILLIRGKNKESARRAGLRASRAGDLGSVSDLQSTAQEIPTTKKKHPLSMTRKGTGIKREERGRR